MHTTVLRVLFRHPFEAEQLEEASSVIAGSAHAIARSDGKLAPTAEDARRLSLVLQDMAGFGARGALQDQQPTAERARQPLDLFA